MREQEDSNLSTEVPGSSSDVAGTTTRKKKKKKKSKVPKNDEGDDDLIVDLDDSHNRKKSKRKKKVAKSQSVRSETSSAVDNESEMSTKKKKKTPQVDDMNQDYDAEYTEDFNEQSNNYMHPRNHEDQSLPYSGSTMDSSMPSSKMYNDRGRNNGHLPPMHMESHNENGFIEYDDGDYMSEMGNMDPVDGYNQDYDMSEDDEEEPRFKYSTADLDEGDCRNTRCYLIAAGIFFILIAILVSVFMAKLQNKDRRRLFTSIRRLRAALT